MAGPALLMNAGERRLLAGIGFASGLLLLLGLPFAMDFVVRQSLAENGELRQALADVQDARGRVRERQARKEAISARYARKAPSLAGFLEQTARAQRLEVPDSTPLPEVPHGKRYLEHGTSIHLRKTGMLALARFLESIERSGYPITVARLDIRKRGGEEDSYDVEVGVAAYDRSESPPVESSGGSTKP